MQELEISILIFLLPLGEDGACFQNGNNGNLCYLLRLIWGTKIKPTSALFMICELNLKESKQAAEFVNLLSENLNQTPKQLPQNPRSVQRKGLRASGRSQR